MRIKQSIRTYISLAIISFFLFHLIPSTLLSYQYYKSHTQNSQVLLSAAVQKDTLFINRDNRKPSFQKTSIRYSEATIQFRSSFGISETKSFYSGLIINYRKKIQQTIPSYFHQGKYIKAFLII